ncbi:MAG: cupredoxin domain-containing protein, partial [Alicyclobacillus sp.]|nr:cupredoxin domain-containing protein [Alicyclobacillus sp.]
LQDGSITPSFVSAKVNQPLRITVVNSGQRAHNLVIPDFYIFTHNLYPGEQVTVSFTPTRTGAFPYYSDAGGKPEPGMQGTLQVTDTARSVRAIMLP